MRYYHGTDEKAGIRILRYGFGMNLCKTPKWKTLNWTCSDPNMTYFVSENYDRSTDDEITDFKELPAVRFAIEAGQIASAHNKSNRHDIIIFELTIDDKYMSPDTSINDMNDCYQIPTKLLNQLIAERKASIKAFSFKNAYEPALEVFYLVNLNPSYYHASNKASQKIIDDLRTHNSGFPFMEDYIGVYDDYTSLFVCPDAFCKPD